MTTALQELIDLVAAHGMDREQAATIADYIADRCSELSITTVHSSGHSALSADEFLTESMGLTSRQIKAWLALLRGTRLVRRSNGLAVGGCPGFLEAVAAGRLNSCQWRRYVSLARRAARLEPAPSLVRELGPQRGRAG